MVWTRVGLAACAHYFDHIANNLREADKGELLAHGHPSVRKGLEDSLRACQSNLFVAGKEDRGIAFFGCGKITDGVGAPWLMGTDEIVRERAELMRLSHEFIPKWQSQFKRLTNMVWVNNTLHIKWLKHMGFQGFVPMKDHPQFLLFWMDRKD